MASLRPIVRRSTVCNLPPVISSMLKMPRQRAVRLLKEGGWVLFGQAIAVVGAVVLVRVMTQYLRPEQYGNLSLAITLGTLVGQVVIAGLAAGIVRYFPIAREAKDLAGYFRTVVTLGRWSFVATVAISVVLLAGIGVIWGVGWVVRALPAIVYLQLANYNAIFSGIQNSARQRKVAALHTGIDPWLRIAVVMPILSVVGPTDVGALTAYCLALLLIFLSQVWFARRLLANADTNGPTVRENWTRQIWTYSVPILAMNPLMWAQSNADRWALQIFSDTHVVGLYAALIQVGFTPIMLAIALVTNFVSPILNQRSGDATDPARNANVHRISWILTGICLAITLVAFVVALALRGPIFSLLVAPDFRSVSYLMPWVLLAGGSLAAGQVLTVKLLSEMNSRALLVPRLVTSLGGTVLTLMGARFAGIDGVVGAAVLFGFAQLAWLAVIAATAPPGMAPGTVAAEIASVPGPPSDLTGGS